MPVGGDWGGLWSVRLKLRGKTAGNGERWPPRPPGGGKRFARWCKATWLVCFEKIPHALRPEGLYTPAEATVPFAATCRARGDTGPGAVFSLYGRRRKLWEYLPARGFRVPLDRHSGDAVSALTLVRVGNGEMGKPSDPGEVTAPTP